MTQDVTLTILTLGVCKSNLIEKVHFFYVSSKMHTLILSVVQVITINLITYKISEETNLQAHL